MFIFSQIRPSGHNAEYVTECIEIYSVPRNLQSKELTINQAFEAEQRNLKNKFANVPKIQILEKSSQEIIYFYQFPFENLKATEIVRLYVSPNAYLLIQYKKGLPQALSKDEILTKKKLIQSIKYKKMGIFKN